MVSCNSDEQSKKIIGGPLGEYFEVVDHDYEVVDGNIRFDVIRVKEGFPAPWNEEMSLGCTEGCFEPILTAEFLDENNNVISKSTTDLVSQQKEMQDLASLKIGKSSTVTFHLDTDNVKTVRFSSSFLTHNTIQPIPEPTPEPRPEPTLEPTPESTPESTPEPTLKPSLVHETKIVDLGFAVFEFDKANGTKNGQPHGNGTMRFKKQHVIPGTYDCMAEAGESVNGAWRDGKINFGTWYRNNGEKVTVKLGQRKN